MFRLKIKRWDNVLKDFFSQVVNEKKYKKIDYTVWKKIKSYTYDEVSLEYDATYEQISVYDFGVLTYTWDINDGSLGEYLYNRFFTEVYNDSNYAISNKYNDTPNTSVLEDLVHQFDKYFENMPINNNNIKEEKKMFNFDFGKVNGNQVHMSVYGMAVKNAEGNWVSYDANTHSMMNVDIINFNAENFMYKIPVAISAVEVGNVVIHNRRPCFVTAINEERNNLMVVDIMSGEEKVILPVRSPFGFNFITKVISFIDFAGSADEKNPFGNMWMLMMMDDNKDVKDILPLMLMSGNGGFDTSNPMAMYAMMTMMDGKDNDNLLPLMFMMSGNK